MVSVRQPRHAARALQGLPPRRRLLAARTMVVLSHVATRGSRRSGTAALLEAVGRRAVGDIDRSEAILDRVALAPGTSARTRVEIGLMLLDIQDVPGAQRIVEELDREGDAAVPGLAEQRLRVRTALALAHHDEAVAAAQRAVRAAPERREPRTLLAQATAERDVHDPAWRPALLPPATPHVPLPGHILHVVSSALPERQSGYVIRTQSVAEAQRAVGLEPLVAAGRQEELRRGVQPPETWNVGGVPYALSADRVLPGDRPDQAIAMYARGIAALVEQHGAALLQPATPVRNLQAALAVGERYGVPVVYEARGPHEGSRRAGPAGSLDRHLEVETALETTLMQQARAVITLSEGMRDDLVVRGVAPEAITVITNAVDVERFVPIPRDDGLARRLRLTDGPVLGYCSTFSTWDDIGTLLEATALLRRRGRRIHCLLVGDGSGSPAQRQRAADLGIGDGTVVFTGRVAHADIQAYYSLIDVFVVPRSDVPVARLVTPLQPYEAMAMERVVVVSRLDGLLSMISEGETGLSFVPGDARELADVVEPLLVDPERRQAIGAAAGAWVRQHRSWQRNAGRYLDLYRRLGVT